MIEAELGVPVTSVFRGIEPSTSPIAAASLGQVYRVQLAEEDQVVAVKVQVRSLTASSRDLLRIRIRILRRLREILLTALMIPLQRPDMHHYVLRDIYILRLVARSWQWLKSTFTYQRPFDVALLDAFAGATLKELDYLNEAANQIKCKEALEPRQRDKIYIPKVYEKHTTRKVRKTLTIFNEYKIKHLFFSVRTNMFAQVLVTEWIEGAQLAKSPPEVINKLIPVGVECFLIQLLETGFFHADPHPGNLLVTPEGRLALIDFGLMADVPIQDTKTMTKTIVHLMQGDVPGLVEDAIQLGFLPEDVDKVRTKLDFYVY